MVVAAVTAATVWLPSKMPTGLTQRRYKSGQPRGDCPYKQLDMDILRKSWPNLKNIPLKEAVSGMLSPLPDRSLNLFEKRYRSMQTVGALAQRAPLGHTAVLQLPIPNSQFPIPGAKIQK